MVEGVQPRHASRPTAVLFPCRQGSDCPGAGEKGAGSAAQQVLCSAPADKKSHVGARTIIKTEVFSELFFW